MAKQVQPELEQERDGIGEGVAETQQPNDPIAEGAPTRQPEKPEVNLDELPAFRKFRSEMDKRLAKEKQERERLEAQYQQQVAAQQQALRERELAEMDDYQRAQYERDEAKREAEYWRQQAALVQTQTARERELGNIAQKFGVPREVLEEATSRAEALEMAWDYQRQQQQEQARKQAEESEERQQQREQKKQANKVDLGSGIGSTPKSDFERAYEKARASGDSVALARLLIPD